MTGTDPGRGPSNPGVTPTAHLTESTEPHLDPYGLLAQAVADRGALLQLCLYALDRARSAAVAERIEQGLAAVGVTPVRPDGLPFDPARHEAAGTVPTDDPALAGRIAETEVAGFADHGRLLRVPVVTVYQLRGGA
ncbi:MAG TPA: nucleotide exchange factor GrpE [Pseudonocardiaceae bacterium]|nr:nucleotide exchange factor GrpE [Pseudonocardiaceae bacterium]